MELQETQIEQPAKPVLPLFILLALASALGVAVALLLAGVAMLLAAPAYADEGALLLERRAGLVQAECVFAESESLEDGQTRVVERLSFTTGTVEVLPAVLTFRRGSALVERTAEIAPGETLLVELEYRPARRGDTSLLTSR